MATRTVRLAEEWLQEVVRDRQRRGIDLYDEVWNRVYVMPSLPSLPHQRLVSGLVVALYAVVDEERKGETFPGANVSDRREGWKDNFRVPDVVVLLGGSRAIDCDSFILGGPDFLVEIQTPGDQTEEKIPFYGELGVRELLIIHRDNRTVRLLRHNGTALEPVEPSEWQGRKWLLSQVVPLAFRRTTQKGSPRTEVRRTDEKLGGWTL